MSKEPLYRFEGRLVTLSELNTLAHERASHFSDPDIRINYLKNINEFYKIGMESQRNLDEHERKKDTQNHYMQTIVAPIIGVVGLTAMVLLVLLNPFPSMFQSGVFWIVISLLSGAFAAMIPGFFTFKYQTGIRAAGAIAITVLIYLTKPKVMTSADPTQLNGITFLVSMRDTSHIEQIPIKFNQNNPQLFCEFAKNVMHDYYSNSDANLDSLTFFRKSDGLIYKKQTCREVEEKDVIAVSNFIVHLLGGERSTYLFFSRK